MSKSKSKSKSKFNSISTLRQTTELKNEMHKFALAAIKKMNAKMEQDNFDPQEVYAVSKALDNFNKLASTELSLVKEMQCEIAIRKEEAEKQGRKEEGMSKEDQEMWESYLKRVFGPRVIEIGPKGESNSTEKQLIEACSNTEGTQNTKPKFRKFAFME